MLYYIYYDILYIVQIILIISCIIRGSNSNMYRLIIIQYIYIQSSKEVHKCCNTLILSTCGSRIKAKHWFLRSLNFTIYKALQPLQVISCERVAPDKLKSQFYLSFWRSNLISCERVATGTRKSQFYLSFSRSNLISCEKVRRTLCKSQFYFSF